MVKNITKPTCRQGKDGNVANKLPKFDNEINGQIQEAKSDALCRKSPFKIVVDDPEIGKTLGKIKYEFDKNDIARYREK